MFEYALILALIVAFAVASMGALTAPISAMLNKVTPIL
jgi:Flp pilus assembly pilin Flp